MNRPSSDAIWWFLQELTSRVVAESGLPSDRYHLGKILLRSFKDAPDFLMQIDGATGERETFQSALERSIRCANSFRNLGLKYQDVIVIMAPNYIDLTTPMYAALYLGIITAGVDITLGVNELKNAFETCVPKLVFCESCKVPVVRESLDSLNIPAQIVVFDENESYLSFSKFLDKYGDDTKVDEFRAEDFDAENTNAMLFATSGSMGLPKAAAVTHKQIMISFPVMMLCRTDFPTPIELVLMLSPVQWLSSTFHFIMSPILRYTRLQTSSLATQDHVYSLINKYKPDCIFLSPTFMITLLKSREQGKCDFSCFNFIVLGGSPVSKELVLELKKINPEVYVKVLYGMSECAGFVFNPAYAPFGSFGTPLGHLQFKLVDPVTNEEICKPNVAGELRFKGSTVIKSYYNNPEMTAAAFDEDGWLKSGDILYRDEYHNYYFVDRLKLILKYKSHQISPLEVERVILKHPDVLDVAVTGIPDDECGDLPVAVVIRREGHTVTAQEIKDWVKDSLADAKQLRGGVIFVNELPTTSTSKIDRPGLKKFVLTSKQE